MVGVPGKYKGCNTCRLRRVKCDNQRPLCKKCSDSGRQCGGYERETVFIIGTLEDQGRCSSHPPRVPKNFTSASASASASVSASASNHPPSAIPFATATESIFAVTETPPAGTAPASEPSSSLPESWSRKGKASVTSFPSSSSLNTLPSRQSPQPPWGSEGSGNQAFSSPEPGQQHVQPQVQQLHESFLPPAYRPQSQGQPLKQPGLLSAPPVSSTSESLWRDWDDPITLSTDSRTYRVRVAALHTNLQYLSVTDANHDNATRGVYGGSAQGETSASGASQELVLRAAPYNTPDLRPHPDSGHDFTLQSRSFLHLSRQDDFTDSEGLGALEPDSIFLFFYQHNNSCIFTNQPPWKDPAMKNNVVRRLGPAHFRSFPNHHLFVHVYRHSAIIAALLNRKPTFLADNEWLTVPWELHPKTSFDRLLDVIAVMPSLLFRADKICAQHPSIPRRLQAQDLLDNCLALEKRLAAWYTGFHSGTALRDADMGNSGGDGRSSSNNTSGSRPSSSSAATMDPRGPAFWVDESHHHHFHQQQDYLGHASQSAQQADQTARLMVPFADDFGFRDGAAAAVMCHYWAALVLLYPCVERVCWTIFEPVLVAAPKASTGGLLLLEADAHADAASIVPVMLPPHLAALDSSQYNGRNTARAAGNVCRALDAAMADERLLQPDLLGGPLFVARRLFEQQRQRHQEQQEEQHQQQHLQLQLQLQQLQQQMVMDGFGVGVGVGGGVGVDGMPDADAIMLDAATVAVAAGLGVEVEAEAEAGVGDARPELMWCEAFRERLVVRGQQIAELAAGRKWQEMGSL